MPLFKNEVGSAIYVWSSSQGQPAKKKAIISAHGGTSNINGMNDAPACQLVFYCPHGQPVNDPSIERVVSRQILSYEKMSAKGAGQDYELSKYTNTSNTSTAHNTAGETYATVGSIDDTFARRLKSAQSSLDQFNKIDPTNLVGKALDNYQQGLKSFASDVRRYQDIEMDIVTIRNRWFKKDITLSWVLKQLWKHGYKYDEVHCSFCRGGGESYTPKVINDELVD